MARPGCTWEEPERGAVLQQILVHRLLPRQPLELVVQLVHPLELGRADGGSADARRQALEAEPCGVRLLEVLPGEAAHDRAPRLADLDETGALELE